MDTETKKEIKEIKISVPEGCEIDEQNSNFECIKFKKKESTSWRSNEGDVYEPMSGYWIDQNAVIKLTRCSHITTNRNVFVNKKLAESALAMAQISQILEHDERFGGIITDEEWKNKYIQKYVIYRINDKLSSDSYNSTYYFLSFHTQEQRDLFLKENEDLVKQYLMISQQ